MLILIGITIIELLFRQKMIDNLCNENKTVTQYHFNDQKFVKHIYVKSGFVRINTKTDACFESDPVQNLHMPSLTRAFASRFSIV